MTDHALEVVIRFSHTLYCMQPSLAPVGLEGQVDGFWGIFFFESSTVASGDIAESLKEKFKGAKALL